MNQEFWSNKRVLLTGHTGFKGSWLTTWLKLLGANICGYSLKPNTDPSMYDACSVGAGIKSIISDIRDEKLVTSAIQEFSPEIVIHMAAQPLVRESYEHTLDTYSTNVMGTANILEAVRNNSAVRVVLVITTDKCYENNEWLWGYRESDRLGGHDPYSSSKACVELIASSYRESFFSKNSGQSSNVALATLRAGNVIGGGDWSKDRLIPDIITAIQGKQPALIRNPNSIRPWQHVLDPLHGYMELAERLWGNGQGYAEGWNFGPSINEALTVGNIADIIIKEWGDDATWRLEKSDNLHEASTLNLDSTKSNLRLNWKTVIDLAAAIEWTVEWYKAYYHKDDMLDFTEKQINDYQSLLQKSA